MTAKEQIISILQSYRLDFEGLGVRNIGLFGSYLRDEQSDQSDIDLLIDFEPAEENFDNCRSVYDLVERIFKGEKIELVNKNGFSKHIGPQILNIVMYV